MRLRHEQEVIDGALDAGVCVLRGLRDPPDGDRLCGVRGQVLRRQSHDGDKKITWVRVALGERIFGKKGERERQQHLDADLLSDQQAQVLSC